MYAVAIRFPAGRYHATGWDHHVNEGTVEWPPSPLRLQRALVATGFKLGWEPGRIEKAVLSLGGLPQYRLPDATFGHTRHFMPTGVIPVEKGRTMVFDAFYAFADGARLGVAWPEAAPDEEVRADLDELWRNLAYLGRAESWADCEPIDGIGEPDALPGVEGAENTRLPALETSEALQSWRATLPPASGKKRGPKAPADLWEVLLTDTGEVQRSGWSRPPGIREVSYGLRQAPIVSPMRSRPTRTAEPKKLALFALSSAVQPDIGRTMSIADRLRRAAMSQTTWLDDRGDRLDERRPDPDPLIAGKDRDGEFLTGNRHAYWLPYSSDPKRPVLDRLLVSVRADEGMSIRAAKALRAIRTVWGDEQHDVFTVFLGFDDDARAGSPDITGQSRVWVTDTPFVPTRHPKKAKGKDLIEHQIRDALVELGFPVPTAIEPLVEAIHGEPWHGIQTARKGGGTRAMLRGEGVRLVFDKPVSGPIAIGYGAHFGLGRFRAV